MRTPGMTRRSPPAWIAGWIRGALLAALLLATVATGRPLRVATYNVEHGIGAAGTGKGDAQRAILRRVDADIVAFQELNRRTRDAWERLADELGYPHTAWGDMGPFSGGMLTGYFSRYPILEQESVRSPEGAREFSRKPLRITVRVPGAAQPLTLWNMHHKALFRPVDDFRRAVEALRIIRDIEHMVEAHPGRTEWVILGDMNDDVRRCRDPERDPQSERFDGLPDGLPRTYVLGPDVEFPLAYRAFPLDTFRSVGPGFHAVDAVREGTDDLITHVHTHYRLDYIFVSTAIRRHPRGPPAGEVHHSDGETGAGLPKRGPVPPRGSTAAASDHYLVFADIHLQPAAETAVTPGARE